MKAPRYLNEWMDELLDKIDENDATSSQISAFFVGLMQCEWEKLKTVELDWSGIKPVIKMTFK